MSFYGKAESVAKTEKQSFPNLDGRTSITAAEIAETYPDGITIYAFGWWKQGELVPVLFKEDSNRFHWAGKVLTSIVQEWMTGYETAEEASRDLHAEGGVKVKIRIGKNKKGQSCSYVEVLKPANPNTDSLPF